MNIIVKIGCWLVWLAVALVLLAIAISIKPNLKAAILPGSLFLPARNNSEAWSFAVIGDLHACSYLRGNSFSNTANSIIAQKSAWNLKFILSPGDLYEADSQYYGTWLTNANGQNTSIMPGSLMTNQLWLLKNAGIPVMLMPGNHDSDYDLDATVSTNLIYWNNVFGTNFYAGDPYFFSNRIAGDTRDIAFKVTVGSCKMLFIGLRWLDDRNTNDLVNGSPSKGFLTTNDMFTAYSTNCAWASNLAKANPDCYIVPFMHYFLDTAGNPNTKDIPTDSDSQAGANASYVNEGPGIVAWNALKSAPNLLMFLCGHVRNTPMVQSTLYADDGHPVNAVKFNTQIGTYSSGGSNSFNGGIYCVYTVHPASKTITSRIYSADFGRFLNDGEFSVNGFKNNYTFRMP